MSAPGERAAALLARLARFGEVEICEKRGRSRRVERDASGEQGITAVEAGWAVRAGDLRRSFFVAGTGELPTAGNWPEPTPHPLWLPEARPAAARPETAGLGAALAGESEARALLAAIERELGREAPAARLVAAHFEEGTSETSIVSSLGVRARQSHRAAWLRLEAARGPLTVVAESWVREARELKALALARRLADRLEALAGEESPGGGALLLAPPVGARLLAAMVPGLVGREAAARGALLGGVGATLGTPRISIVDDGARPDGLLAAAFDGEGVPCGAVTLVEAGRLARPLLAWWESDTPASATGCMRRASWRDLPRRAPTHLHLLPDPEVSPRDLLAAGGAVAYVIDVEGGVRADPASGTFALPVSGFALLDGRDAGGFGRRWLRGNLRHWLTGVRALGRDLAFVAGDGMFGAPSLLCEGLELSDAAS